MQPFGRIFVAARPGRDRSARGRGTAALLACVLLACLPSPGAAQPLTERTPNLAGTWVSSPWNLHFQFSHRFQVTGAGEDVTDIFGDGTVVNYPTFELAYGLPASLLAGVRYSSNSLIARHANEWQPFLRWSPVTAADGPASVAVSGAWNSGTGSLDGELAVQTTPGRLLLSGAVRGFSDAYDLPAGTDDEALALAAGVGVRLNRYLLLAADVADVVTGPHGPVGWSAGLQIGIPYTPHTLSLLATNVTSGTLEGSSTGLDGTVFWGFEFTVPFSGFARWGRIFSPEELRAAAPAEVGDAARVVEVEISGLAFGRSELRVPPGTTVRWVNRDPVAHTATSDDSSWGSPSIGPGETWSHTFERPGRHPYHCVPHPFMEAVVIVQEP